MSRFRLADLGPGLLLAAAGIGVGDMVSSIIAGDEYGLTLIWALAAGVLVKYAITERTPSTANVTPSTSAIVAMPQSGFPRIAIPAST